ncbi:MAG TPA: PHP domain-containing protein [Armatimonadota bacterium]|jgi:hypothetical protein
MAHVDLHLHTTFSDGTSTPEELVATAHARGVTLIAITDHDEVRGIAPAQAAAQGLPITVVAGVEINTELGREDIHILGYGFSAESAALLAGLHARREARVERTRRILARLAAIGYPLEFERVLAIAGQGSIGRPHIARALVEAGHVATSQEAFERLIGHRCPAYIATLPFTPEAAIALIHQAGGIASLAHPGKLGDPIRIIRRLKEAGLEALEAYHSDHTPNVTARMLRWAAQFGLALTGGSDSHGPHGSRVVHVGAVPVPDAVGEALLALLAAHQHQ